MEQTIVKYNYEFFKKLIEVYGFKMEKELIEEQSCKIEYSSDDFIIKIEKYFREFYLSLYKINKPESEINLFNLLDFLRQSDKFVPRSEYFHNEKNIEECYRKQFAHLSSIIYDNYELIIDFFREGKYESNEIEFEKYWKGKHPEFYKTV